MVVIDHTVIKEPVAPAFRAIASDDFIVIGDYNSDFSRPVCTALGGAAFEPSLII